MPAEATANESLKALPVGMLLTDALQAAGFEVRKRGLTPDVEDNYPSLADLSIRAFALWDQAHGPGNEAAARFRSTWNDLDRRYGDPDERTWCLVWREALERWRLIVRYLTATGALSLSAAEVDAPRYYLSREEREGA